MAYHPMTPTAGCCHVAGAGCHGGVLEVGSADGSGMEVESVKNIFSKRVRDRLRPLHRRIAGSLPPMLRRSYLYTAGTGRILNVRSPRTFCEKINWRILEDRRPRLVEVCDKLRMKEIARDAVASEEMLRIPRTLWHGTDVREIPAALWSGDWVLKPNHSSGRVLLSPDSRDPEQIHRATVNWLEEEQFSRLGEWGYSRARRLILMEEMIPGVQPLTDYKIHCFDGEPAYTLALMGRFDARRPPACTAFDNRWVPQSVRFDDSGAVDIERPRRLGDMLEVARRLSAGWDYLRVDLYAIGEDIWFGELSPYPGGGVMKISPSSFDRHLGDLWTLPALRPEEKV